MIGRMMKTALFGSLCTTFAANADVGADPLEKGFANPPAQARPGVWWRWIDANISKEGITRDLTEMARKGISSAQIFDVSGGAVVGTAGMMTPEWRALFKFAVQEAARLGITLVAVPAAGWGTGGPWIKAMHAAKALRYAEIQADGPGHLSRVLPKAEGPEGWYRDVAVVAFREGRDQPVQPAQVEASSEVAVYYGIERNWTPNEAVDTAPDTYWRAAAPPSEEKPAWIQLRYHEPITAQSIFLAGTREGGPKTCELQVSDKGVEFRKVTTFEMAKGEAKRVKFASVTASIFRLAITSAHVPDVQLAGISLLRKGDNPVFKPGIKWWRFKSGNRSLWDWPKQGPAILEDEYPEDGAVDCRNTEVLDISSRMDADGKLEWDVPPGRWTIARFGTVLLDEGVKVMSRATKGKAYEADPLSPKAADRMFDSTTKILLEDVGKLGGKTFNGVLVDSWEYGAGGSRGLQPTWTDDFRERFKKRHGYDLVAYLPAMARKIVDSRDKTNRFFWDYRQIMAEAYLDFYARLTERANQRGMHSTAECGYGTYPFQHIDGLAAFGRVDVPMGEFWYISDVMSQFFAWADSIRTAASSAHIYGKNLVSAETLSTANGFEQTPDAWKITLDRELANGLNLPIMSVFSHQNDVNARPGVFSFESINVNMTWWDMSQGFLSYLARCQFLLQAGIPVADACYFFGENSCKFVPAKEFLNPPLPDGCEFDGINAEVITKRLSVKNGLLTLPNGISYRYLVLPVQPGWKVTASTLRKIKDLVDAGATVIGPKPSAAPGLEAYPNQDKEVAALADALWGATPTAAKVRKVGQGRVIRDKTIDQVLALDATPTDLALEGMTLSKKLNWCHRRTDGAEIYFISNQERQPQAGTVTFRVAGKVPEIWDPVTGKKREAADYAMADGRTTVPLELADSQSLFVVFRHAARAAKSKGLSRSAAAAQKKDRGAAQSGICLTAPWTVTFDPKWGGPAEAVKFKTLEDWTKRPEEEIRTYSGTATYKTTFDLPESQIPNRKSEIFLDLGIVKNMAQVRLNGKDLGVVWTAPWRLEISGAVKAKGNKLEIDVANVLLNRLITDGELPPEKRLTKINSMFYGYKKGALLPSGLLGPVRVLTTLPALPR